MLRDAASGLFAVPARLRAGGAAERPRGGAKQRNAIPSPIPHGSRPLLPRYNHNVQNGIANAET
jgi:hypothetical protein